MQNMFATNINNGGLNFNTNSNNLNNQQAFSFNTNSQTNKPEGISSGL